MFGDSYNNMCHDFVSLFHASDADISLYLYQLDYVGQKSLTDLFPGCEKLNNSEYAYILLIFLIILLIKLLLKGE